MPNPMSANELADKDIRKAGRGFARYLRVAGQANLELVSGTARAVGNGYQVWSRSLTDENVTEWGFANGFVEGALQGWKRTLSGLQEVWTNAFAILEPAVVSNLEKGAKKASSSQRTSRKKRPRKKSAKPTSTP